MSGYSPACNIKIEMKKILFDFRQRLADEIKYIFSSNWTFKDVGEHWNRTMCYDDINEKTYTYFRRFVDAHDLFNLPDKKKVLDICSRTGNGSVYFWQKGKIEEVVCADVAGKMEKICCDNLSKYKINFKTRHFESYPLPFENNEFETILSFETIEHLPDPKIYLKELYRILVAGGYLVLTMPNILWGPAHWIAAIFNIHHSEGPHGFIRNNKVKRWLRKTGFKIIRYNTFILIPGGPECLLKCGEWLEKTLPVPVVNLLGLRRIYICQK